jgi:hypothetical protein
VFAGRALNLPTGKLRLALQWLIAVGTVEFEFVRVHSLCLYRREPDDNTMLGIIPYFLPTNCG